MLIVPPEQLRPQTLDALIEEFVTRAGAVHGHADVCLSRQIEAVRRQLRCRQAVIVFDEDSETWSIRPVEG